MQKLKQILFAAVLGITFMNPALALAQGSTGTANDTSTKGGIGITDYKGVDESITKFLCTPSDPPNGRDVELCVNKMYRFGVAFGAIALVFFVVFAGYVYMTGGEADKGKAKGILQNALIGMGLLLGSYLLLGFINPNLLLFRSIQPPIFNASNIPTCEAVGFGVNCVIASAEPGSDFSTDTKFTGSYEACGKNFSDPESEKSKVKSLLVKVWTLSGNAKVSKTINIQVHECILERTKKAFLEYYNDPEKFPISDLGGYNVRTIAGRTTWSAHSYGLTIDISSKYNCHADNDGTCKSKDFIYKPCPGVGCSPYSITANSSLVKAFKANGFGWGGQWKSSKDYMHFSCAKNEQGSCI